MGDCRFSHCRTTKILPHFPHAHDAARRFDWSTFLRALGNRPDKSPQYKPRRSRTQRAFLKPRSTAPSSVDFAPDRLRSASISETPAQCERHPRKMMVDHQITFHEAQRVVGLRDKVHDHFSNILSVTCTTGPQDRSMAAQPAMPSTTKTADCAFSKRQGQDFPIASPNVLAYNQNYVEPNSPPTRSRWAPGSGILAGLPGTDLEPA
jgi:hypothetical protein